MKTIEKNLLIKIPSGRTCGMSLIVLDIPEESAHCNKAMEHIMKQDLPSVEVEEVECIKDKDSRIIQVICSIDKMENATLALSYVVSLNDYMYVSDFYKTQKSPRKAKNENKAVMLVKNIIDSYDPFIQVKSE